MFIELFSPFYTHYAFHFFHYRAIFRLLKLNSSAGCIGLFIFSNMKAASVSEIKQELKELSAIQLTELCLRLARFKKENKELLTYLLFEAHDLPAYLNSVKEQIDEDFAQINTTNIYFAKKTLRKILRIANKYIRYTGSKEAEIEILLYYCTNFNGLKISWHKSTALTNLYNAQLKKINAAIATMHEDLQHDYQRSVERLVLIS